jgi:uncharacterized protein (TIGR03546 family)
MFTNALNIDGDGEVDAQSLSPSLISHSIAYGIVIGLIPKDNLLAIAGMAFIFCLPLHRVSTILSAVLVSLLPWLTDPISHQLGEISLQPLVGWNLWQQTMSLPIVPWLGIQNTVVLGGLLFGLIMYPVNLLMCRTALRFVQRRMLQQRIDEIFTAALDQTAHTRKRAHTSLSEEYPPIEKFQLHVAEFSLDEEVALAEDSNAQIDFTPIAEDPSSASSDMLKRLAAESLIRFDTPGPAVTAAPAAKASSTNDVPSSEMPKPQLASPASTTMAAMVTSIYPATNVRIDVPEDVTPNKPVISETPVEFANALETVRYQSDAEIKEGSLVRDTVIEVIRFRANNTGVDQANPAQVNPSLVTSFDSNKEIMPEQLIIDDSTNIATKQKLQTAAARSDRNEHKNAEQNSASDQRGPASTSAFHPGEESLRFLLWHLNSANRENRE